MILNYFNSLMLQQLNDYLNLIIFSYQFIHKNGLHVLLDLIHILLMFLISIFLVIDVFLLLLTSHEEINCRFTSCLLLLRNCGFYLCLWIFCRRCCRRSWGLCLDSDHTRAWNTTYQNQFAHTQTSNNYTLA